MKTQRKNTFPHTGFTLLELIVLLAIVGVIIGGIFVWRGKKAAATNEQEQGPLKVKGFYVGMHTNELRPIVEASFPDWKLQRAVDQPDWLMLAKDPADASRMFKDDIHVNFQFDSQGTVTAIAMTPLATDAVFNSASMGAQEFAKTFIDAYGIPEMKAEQNYWVWNGNGVKVRITKSKMLAIEKFSSESVKDNFN